ncbi:MAG: hypothetical protein KGI28_10415, partial [Thaumarchaeota archaeon]|nr:hypothetical protein [Nitrososphaerota archaeon]
MNDENELLLDSVFLELGSEQRRLIIFSLNEKTQRLSKLSTELNMTIQEAHRHVSRLESIGLIQHDAGNVLKLTPYGKTIVNLIPSFQFL